MKLPISVKPLVLALVTTGLLGSALHGATPLVAHADGDNSVPCASSVWPTLPNLDFGRVTPGSNGGANESFITHAGGSLSATVTDGADTSR